MDARKLKQIQKRFDEYSAAGGPGYKAFLYRAHEDVGALLDEVKALRETLREIERGALSLACEGHPTTTFACIAAEACK